MCIAKLIIVNPGRIIFAKLMPKWYSYLAKCGTSLYHTIELISMSTVETFRFGHLATGCHLCMGLMGHSGRVVTLLPPTSEAGVRFPARPQVGQLVVTCCCSATVTNCMYWFPLPVKLPFLI